MRRVTKQKDNTFLHINDGSCLSNLQAVGQLQEKGKVMSAVDLFNCIISVDLFLAKAL